MNKTVCDGCGRSPAYEQPCEHCICVLCWQQSVPVSIGSLSVRCPICGGEEY